MASSDLIDGIIAKAKSLKQTIVLPDATDERAIQAARILTDQQIVTPILIGDRTAIQAQAKKTGTSLDGIPIVDPATSDRLDAFAARVP